MGLLLLYSIGWQGGSVGGASDSRSEDPRFEPRQDWAQDKCVFSTALSCEICWAQQQHKVLILYEIWHKSCDNPKTRGSNPVRSKRQMGFFLQRYPARYVGFNSNNKKVLILYHIWHKSYQKQIEKGKAIYEKQGSEYYLKKRDLSMSICKLHPHPLPRRKKRRNKTTANKQTRTQNKTKNTDSNNSNKHSPTPNTQEVKRTPFNQD